MAKSPLEALLGNETIRTIVIWGVVMQLAQPIMAPLLQAIQNEVEQKFPNRPLPPADAVDAAIRGHLPLETAAKVSAESGIPRQDFDTLYKNAGEPPPLEMLFEMFRRNLIGAEAFGDDPVSLEQGIKESRLKNKWIAAIEQLQFHLPDPGVVIEGWLRAQVDEATARDWLKQNGISDEVATLMYKAAGRPPSPDELFTLWHRGKIPLDGLGGDTLSVEQGFFETDLKNKWWAVYPELARYLPPPRTITAMIREGAMSDEQGLALFKASGLDQQLAAQYVAAAHHQKLQADKELTKTEILSLYEDHLIGREQAAGLLGPLGYRGATADYLLQLADFHVVQAQIRSAMTKLHSLFVARKLDAGDVSNALSAVGAASSEIDQLLAGWVIERESQVKTLTAAEWASAVYYEIVPEDVGIAEIQGLGYPAYDAWAMVALRLKGGGKTAPPGPPPPPKTAAGV